MGITALVLAIIGGLCGVMGVITSFDILDEPIIKKLYELEFLFWFMASGILLLGSIVAAVVYKRNSVD